MYVNLRALQLLVLLNDGLCHSVNTLAKNLACSIKSIYFLVDQLHKYRIDIENINEDGFRLCNPIIWLNKDLILSHISVLPERFDLKLFDVIDSTNNYLLQQLKRNALNKGNVHVIVSEFQSSGRGREGHIWECGFGNGLMFSMCWYFEKSVSDLSGLSLAIGIAIVRVLKANSIQNIQIKWPNDILCENQKLAGILTEIRSEMHGPTYAVIGVGINCNLSKSVKTHINQEFTDLSSIASHLIDRNQLLGQLLTEFCQVLNDFESYGFTYFKKEWISYHSYEGREVDLKSTSGPIVTGIIDGVTSDGAICLLTPEGKKSFSGGSIFVRPRYTNV
ncbi:biotin--[acetyl-CoA-carboxylase] ligase [Nitrosomonas supralitoralis]|uniref:biotin--[biotin carboxyl-carrier protein] ligase n=1 Tax=Nitrosomonas supralitoralis TaxID=2116706 RepID=A0A2P7NX44_9PROT|nr:biotin--[acetyl-CoA-carboxylase] ligase [Nitrosomonas supralitoralis]